MQLVAHLRQHRRLLCGRVRLVELALVGKLFPPAAFMRRWSPLARRGPLGLAASYAYRPVWLLLKLGPAVVTWRRARRAGQRAR